MIDLKKQKLLIIAPHPDDEVIGCGGLIQRVKEEGGKVYILFLTVGNTNDFSKKRASSAIGRKKEIKKVASFLEYDGYDIALEGSKYHLKLDLLGQKRLLDIIERESSVSIEKVKPTIVAFPLKNSYNQDHRIAALAVHASVRPAEKKFKHFVPIVLAYEAPADTWSINSCQTLPNVFIPLTKRQMYGKLTAMKLYASQVKPFPNLRSLEILKIHAILRGAAAGEEFAEGYTAYRIIV